MVPMPFIFSVCHIDNFVLSYIIVITITTFERILKMKYSRQRECIIQYLRSTTCHPTAETVHEHILQDCPNISLGTVYRNLSLLTELGEIQKITAFDGPDRFDGNKTPHYHFICSQCGAVIDLNMDSLSHINLLAAHNFDGTIEGHTAHFYGKCPDCAKRYSFLQKQ